MMVGRYCAVCSREINLQRKHWKGKAFSHYYICSLRCIGKRALQTHCSFLQEVKGENQ